jgi:hypothetical protein
MDIFTADAHFVVFMRMGAKEPAQEYHKREDLAPVLDNLNSYEATTHFNGQSTISIQGETGTAESHCLAHHVSVAEGKRSMATSGFEKLPTLIALIQRHISKVSSRSRTNSAMGHCH